MANKKEEMKPIKWLEKENTVVDCLGIPGKRGEELDYRLSLIVHEVTKPLRRDEEGPDSGIFIKMCLALAQTEEERIYCAYTAGAKVAELFASGHFEEYEEDES
jgi:hypothetical protein